MKYFELRFIPLTEAEWDAFNRRCLAEGLRPSAMAAKLILALLNGKVDMKTIDGE